MRLSIRPPRWYQSSAPTAKTKGAAERTAETPGKGVATASSTPIARPPTITARREVKRPGIDAQDRNADQAADLAIIGKRTHRQTKPAAIEEDDHAQGHRDTQAKRDRARRGNTHPDHLESEGVGREAQAARPL